MLPWICPQSGREVPPAYTDCPDCAPKKTDAPPEAQPASPPAPVNEPAPPPPARAYQPPPNPRAGLPTSLLNILFAFSFFGRVAGVYWIVGAARGTNVKPAAAVESPAAKPNAKTSP